MNKQLSAEQQRVVEEIAQNMKGVAINVGKGSVGMRYVTHERQEAGIEQLRELARSGDLMLHDGFGHLAHDLRELVIEPEQRLQAPQSLSNLLREQQCEPSSKQHTNQPPQGDKP